MADRVGTADGQSEGLQVMGIGEPWPIYLQGMEECYLLEPLVIRGLSHSVNLGLTFLQNYGLKLECTKEEGINLMPVRGNADSRARLVDGGCVSFENSKSRKIWNATSDQEISTQAWRIPREKVTINALKDVLAGNVGVYAKEQCSIPAGTGKYIPVQTNQEIYEDVLIEANNKTATGFILSEIIYNARKKLGCIFIENHNSVSFDLQH